MRARPVRATVEREDVIAEEWIPAAHELGDQAALPPAGLGRDGHHAGRGRHGAGVQHLVAGGDACDHEHGIEEHALPRGVLRILRAAQHRAGVGGDEEQGVLTVGQAVGAVGCLLAREDLTVAEHAAPSGRGRAVRPRRFHFPAGA